MSGTEPGSGLAVALGATDKLGANGEVAVEVGGGGGGYEVLHWKLSTCVCVSVCVCVCV